MTEPSGWTAVVVDSEDESQPSVRFWIQTSEAMGEQHVEEPAPQPA